MVSVVVDSQMLMTATQSLVKTMLHVSMASTAINVFAKLDTLEKIAKKV